MPLHKVQELLDAEETHVKLAEENGANEQDSDLNLSGSDRSSGDESSFDTEDEIEVSQNQKSRQTSKRKLRATGASNFGLTLKSLLNTEAPSTQPLSLKPSIARKRNDEKLELRAKKVLQVEKKEKEDKARIKDVIGGWGGESERALRKVAQRGVVKLFNVIQQSQASASAAVEETKSTRGTGKAILPAPTTSSKGRGKGKNKDNIIGRGREIAVEEDDFFNMIRSGGVVSNA